MTSTFPLKIFPKSSVTDFVGNRQNLWQALSFIVFCPFLDPFWLNFRPEGTPGRPRWLHFGSISVLRWPRGGTEDSFYECPVLASFIYPFGLHFRSILTPFWFPGAPRRVSLGPPGHPRELEKVVLGRVLGQSKKENLIFWKQAFRLDETSILETWLSWNGKCDEKENVEDIRVRQS